MLYNGFVYLAKSDTGHYKIGLSKSPYERIKHFDTIMPVKVEIIHYFPCDDPKIAERALHLFYKPYRITGEWFEMPEYMAWIIERIRYFLNGQFVSHMPNELFPMETCCYESIQEALIRNMWIEINGKTFEIHGKPVG